MVVVAKDWCSLHFAGKYSPWYRVDWCVVSKKGVGNIDWRGDWECAMAVDIGRWLEGHSCVDGSDSVWVLWEVVGFLGMCMQNAQLGYIVGKSLNHQWCKNFCSFQEECGRH